MKHDNYITLILILLVISILLQLYSIYCSHLKQNEEDYDGEPCKENKDCSSKFCSDGTCKRRVRPVRPASTTPTNR